MQKRGQFFLIAAVIIVSAVISITSVMNSARVQPKPEEFYSISDEIKFETYRVMDYGVYYQRDGEGLARDFLEDYAPYIAQDRAIFIVGNENGVRAFYFQSNALGGSINIVTGQSTVLPIRHPRNVDAVVTRNADNSISVILDGQEYSFRLNDGQNFFFVMAREEQDETFVRTG